MAVVGNLHQSLQKGDATRTSRMIGTVADDYRNAPGRL